MRTRLCLLLVTAALTLAGCGRVPAAANRPAGESSAIPFAAGSEAPPASGGTDSTTTGAHAAASPSSCAASGWDCGALGRLDAAAQYVRQHPGRLGAIVRDR